MLVHICLKLLYLFLQLIACPLFIMCALLCLLTKSILSPIQLKWLRI